MISTLLTLFLFVLPAHAQDDTCLMCHANEAAFAGKEDAARLVVDEEILAHSVHGEMGFTCTTCHPDIAGDKLMGHTQGGAQHADPPACATCHPGEVREYAQSMHGELAAEGSALAPSCGTCHTAHDIRKLDDPESSVSRAKVQQTCATCHGQEGQETPDHVHLPDSTEIYSHSVHAVLTEDGLPRATCSDCHDAHALEGGTSQGWEDDAAGSPETCGQCHAEVTASYLQSIHGRARAAGLEDNPGCTDCHGEHDIQATGDRDAQGKRSVDTCGSCHEDPVIIAKYGLQGGVASSYHDSYHGWANALGGEEAATCVDCHTAHDVQPASDPRSSVHPDRVAETCSRCHEGANESFARSYDHVSASTDGNPINRVISLVYTVLILGTIGGMAGHNLLVFSWFLRQRIAERKGRRLITRMSTSEVIQHLLLAVTFSGLVVTGFALRFSDSFWVQGLVAVGLTEPVRAHAHRLFAVGMVITSVWHVGWLMTPRGREAVFAMLPTPYDLLEVKDNLLYHLGLSSRRPRFGRYDYTQKVEYWALIWGTGVMVLTGFILWFPTWFTSFLPWWVVSAAQNVHYYEAWLAFLAIVIWHGFYVIFHPERYPLELTWIDGKMSVDEAHHHHPKWDVDGEGEDSGPSDTSGT